MRKHIIGVLIAILVIILAGVLVWFFVFKNANSGLYSSTSSYIHNDNTTTLQTYLAQSNQLYTTNSRGETTENRLLMLAEVIDKMNIFEKDLNAYLVVDAKKTSKISKSYKILEGSRELLLEDLDKYIIRMSGNTAVDGTSVKDLYNDMVVKTANFIGEYNECFIKTVNYVFDKVYTSGNIKKELYTLYSYGVNNLISTMENYKFPNANMIKLLNDCIKLENNSIKFTVDGGEFHANALNFKTYFYQSNLSNIVENFITYYYSTADITDSLSNEQLTAYYFKLVWGV